MIALSPTLIVFILVALVFLAFIKESFSPDIIALAAVAALLAFGIINDIEFLSIFSNSAPITIAFMFIISKALERTGCLQSLGSFISKLAGKSYLRALLVTMFLVMIVSAFMNSTPVVILMTPIVIALSRSIGVKPSKMLIPLSFAAIFGGSTTLIGTSTNLLVSGIAIEKNLPAIGMFEMTLPGLIFAAVGMIYMMFASKFLLPDRHSLSGILDGQPKRKFLAELTINKESIYIGKSISNISEISKKARVISIVRNGEALSSNLKKIILQHKDCIVIEANAGEVLGLKENGKFDFTNIESAISNVSAEERMTMEGSINSHSSLIGKKIKNLNFHNKYGVYILAIHRNGDKNVDINNTVLKFGDTLLIEGSAAKISKLLEGGNIINLTQPQEKPMLKSKAPIAILTILSVITLSALEVMPIASLALIGAVVVMLTRCVEAEEAYEAIEWKILFLIFGMIGLSIGMEKTGTTTLIVNHIVSLVGDMNPIVILAAIYVLTSVLTEMVSNNAIAVVITPVAMTLADQLGFDSKPFIIAIMFAASASFATPIGYQTNTFVYGAGGYKFTDFLKIGIPLNIIFAILATIILPIFFPF